MTISFDPGIDRLQKGANSNVRLARPALQVPRVEGSAVENTRRGVASRDTAECNGGVHRGESVCAAGD